MHVTVPQDLHPYILVGPYDLWTAGYGLFPALFIPLYPMQKR